MLSDETWQVAVVLRCRRGRGNTASETVLEMKWPDIERRGDIAAAFETVLDIIRSVPRADNGSNLK